MTEREEALLRQQVDDIKHVMSTENGRRFVWRLLGHAGIYKDIESEDPIAMAKQVGVRKGGLYLLKIITDAGEDALFTMMQEARNDAKMEEYKIAQEEKKREDDKFSTMQNEVDNLIM